MTLPASVLAVLDEQDTSGRVGTSADQLISLDNTQPHQPSRTAHIARRETCSDQETSGGWGRCHVFAADTFEFEDEVRPESRCRGLESWIDLAGHNSCCCLN